MKYVFSNYTASGVALGGIGAGSVEVRADGLLHDWLIFNNGVWTTLEKYRQFYPLDERGFFLAVRAESGGRAAVRMLQSRGYVLGGDPYKAPWLKPVKAVEYSGEPPLARLKYVDDLPLEISAEFLSPFIPGDLKSSSTPAVVIRIVVRNASSSAVKAAVMAGLRAPFKRAAAKADGGIVTVRGLGEPDESPLRDGSMALAIRGGATSFAVVRAPGYEEYGFQRYEQTLEMLTAWINFRREGGLQAPSAGEGQGLWALAAASAELGPGEARAIDVVLTWYFPNHYDQFGERLGHYYENFFADARAVAEHVLKNLDYLYGETVKFHDALYGLEGLDGWVADLVASQLTTLVKATWLTKDGRFALWEGLGDKYYGGPALNAFNTTDVIFYAFPTLLSLFPELAAKYLIQHAAHALARGTPEWAIYALAMPENRAELEKELGRDPSIALDFPRLVEALARIVDRTGLDPAGRIGHFFEGSIEVIDAYHMVDLMPKYALMAYTAAKWAGNLELLRNLWPVMKGAVESVVKSQSRDGLPYHTTPAGIEWENAVRSALARRFPAITPSLVGQRAISMGYQTFDTWAFYGVSSYVLFLWIAALEAMADAAERLGEAGGAYDGLLQRARASAEMLWNGEYFKLWLDPATGEGDDACMAAQLLGQLAARVAGLGDVVDPAKARTALRAIARHNLAADEGLINGVYPGEARPSYAGPRRYKNFTKGPYLPTWQMDTPWSGVEFAVAGLMLYEGLVDEALAVLREVHERYARAGHYWNHVEWGRNYMRPLSSWLVAMGALGISYDGYAEELRIKPAKLPIKWIYAVEGAWGVVKADERGLTLEQLHGELKLRGLRLWAKAREVRLNGRPAAAAAVERGGEYAVELEAALGPGDRLDVVF